MQKVEDVCYLRAIVTTGILIFAECYALCQVLFYRALGKVLSSVTIVFAESMALGTGRHSVKSALPSA